MNAANPKERLERVIDALARAACQDYGHRVQVGEEEDDLLELEVGVNILLEDLQKASQRNAESMAEIERKNREIAEQAALALRELATPIISVWQGVLALPVVGAVDTERSADMVDTLLQRVVSEQATHVVIDITGVSVLDTRTADHFIRMSKAVRLLGADCFLTGISPLVAQTLAQQNVDTSVVRTVRRLSDALAEVFRELKVTVHQTAA
ncbi:MAG TPA: STAS domain-containing protein [Myxococcales bacterium]|jgi:rsbT co-antagonist protein RsbR|nr:STAS domain-containing protein [Myxococcales bacterium]